MAKGLLCRHHLYFTMQRVRCFLQWLLQRFDVLLLILDPLTEVYFVLEKLVWLRKKTSHAFPRHVWQSLCVANG